MKKRWWGAAIAGLALLGFRLYFSLRYFHVDIWSNAAWGQWIAENGTKGFFYNNVWVYSWPTQLPLVNLIYSWSHDLSRYLMIGFIRFDNLLEKIGIINEGYKGFVTIMNSNVTTEIPFKNVFLLSIKLIPIIADVILAGVIWMVANRCQISDPPVGEASLRSQEDKLKTGTVGTILTKENNIWIWPVIYLISPFSWYISAFWGQYDQLSFLFLLLSILTIKRFKVLSPIFMSISLGIKPTSAIFIPFYLYLLWEERKYWRQYLFGGIMGISLNLYWVNLFNQETDLIKFIRGRLWSAVINKSEPRVTVNSYNFWHLFTGEKARNPGEWFLFMRYQWWGILGLLSINWLGIKTYIKSKKNMWLGLAVVGIGSWMVGMNMLERYLFAGVAFGLLACINNKWLVKPWLGLSIMFFINLYKNWWQPPIFDFLRIFQEKWALINQLVMPLIFIVIFGYILKKVYEENR